VSVRARADHRDTKANAGAPMIKNEHVQTNGRKATCVDLKYRPDWIRIGGHWPRVTQLQERMEQLVMSSFTPVSGRIKNQ
jgi:hypothetical protein